MIKGKSTTLTNEKNEVILPVTGSDLVKRPHSPLSVEDSLKTKVGFKYYDDEFIEHSPDIETSIIEINTELDKLKNKILTDKDINISDALDEFKGGTLDIVLSELNSKSDSNKDNILLLNDELKESENTKRQTVNGICEFESKDGYATNFKMEGKTLVNLWNADNAWVTDNAGGYAYNQNKNANMIRPNKKYTLFNFSDKTIKFEIYTTPTSNEEYEIPSNSSIKIQSPSTVIGKTPIVIARTFGWDLNQESYNIADNSIVIIEGDDVTNIIKPFNGIMSLGQYDGIDILSCEGCNLYNKNDFTFNDGVYIEADITSPNYGNETPLENFCYTNEFISIGNYEWITVYNGNRNIIQYDTNKNLLPKSIATNFTTMITLPSGGQLVIIKLPSECKYIRLTMPIKCKDVYKIFNGKYDKTIIPLTIRSIGDISRGIEFRDLVEENNGCCEKKEYLEEYILGGYENWNLEKETDTHLCFDLPLSKNKACQYRINDRLPLISHDEYISCSMDGIRFESVPAISIKKSMLPTPNLEGFKAWLKNNNIRIIQNLYYNENPKFNTIKIPNFNPEVFNKKTSILLNTGPVQGEAEFETTNNIRNELSKVKDIQRYIEQSIVYNTYEFQKHKMCEDDGQCITIDNLNNQLKTGYYISKPDSIGSPEPGRWFIVQNIVGNFQFRTQISYHYNSGDPTIFIRKCNGPNIPSDSDEAILVWGPWYKITPEPATTKVSIIEKMENELNDIKKGLKMILNEDQIKQLNL